MEVKNDILNEYPLTKLHTDLYLAEKNNLTYASNYINSMISNVNRQLPLSMNHVNQIAIVSFSGQIINLMR